MDSFKPAELARLDLGGNNSWIAFWEQESGKVWGSPGKGGDGEAMSVLGERYGGVVGEVWKERLACRVEGRVFMGVVGRERERKGMEAREGVGAEMKGVGGTETVAGGVAREQRGRNEEFFARKGNENAARPEGLAPSRGGKYAGFGSEPAVKGEGEPAPASLPGVDEFGSDPVKALSKGFGWFASTVGKGARTVNDGWIQPTAQKACCSLLRHRFCSYIPLSISLS